MAASNFYLQLTDRQLSLDRPLLMGILNITPDSFYDGGSYPTIKAAVERAKTMIAAGADIIDIGAESTRPNAKPVTSSEEIARLTPVVQALLLEITGPISIDTSKPEVMAAMLELGAHMINDINALSTPGAVECVAKYRAGVCLMHMQGTPQTMQSAPAYKDVLADITEFLRTRSAICRAGGIDATQIIIDPGFGFGKTAEQNARLLANLQYLTKLNQPILVGLSRKSMFGKLLGLPIEKRLTASVTAAVLAVKQGAAIIRTHDVTATRDAIDTALTIAKYKEIIDG